MLYPAASQKSMVVVQFAGLYNLYFVFVGVATFFVVVEKAIEYFCKR